MTRFKHHKTQPHPTTKGKKLTVMVREETQLENLHSAVSSNLSKCQEICEIVNRELQAPKLSDELLEIAHRYFLTPLEGIADSDLGTIKTVVDKVWTGLKGDVTIKTGEKVGKAKTWDKDKNRQETDPLGVVQRTATQTHITTRSRVGPSGRGQKEVIHGAAPITKEYHNIHVSSQDRKDYRWGAIRIRQAALGDRVLGPVTIIHEATHKYAGTWDCWYYDDQGITVKKMRASKMDKDLALQNADSYAWFMWNVSRPTAFIQDDVGTTYDLDLSELGEDFLQMAGDPDSWKSLPSSAPPTGSHGQ
jgi:hypothetical protein